MSTRSVRATLAATACLLAVAGLAGCGKSNSGTSTTPATSAGSTSSAVDPALAAKVPADVKADGKITVGTDATYAPSEFLDADGKTVKGFDVDLFNAVAAKLGLKVDWQVSSFDAIIPGIGTKYEMGVSSFTIDADRLKQATMVSYFNAGTSWVTLAGNPQKINPDDACGQQIGVQKATVQDKDLTARSQQCTTQGKKAISIDRYAAQDQLTAAVVSGKESAMLADSPVAAYAVAQTQSRLELLGSIYDSAPYGYVLPKSETDFADVIRAALVEVMADGTYHSVLGSWGVTSGAITQPAVNPTVG